MRNTEYFNPSKKIWYSRGYSKNIRLANALKAVGMTYKELARICILAGFNLDASDIGTMIKGQLIPSWKEACVIAETLKLTPEFLWPFFETVPEEIRNFINIPKGHPQLGYLKKGRKENKDGDI